MMEDFEGESDVKIQQYEHQLCGKCAHSTKHSRAFVPYYTILTKGQIIWKADWRAIDSPKKTEGTSLFCLLFYSSQHYMYKDLLLLETKSTKLY